MNARVLEAFLARLYTDEVMRRAFLEEPDVVAFEAGLDEESTQWVLRIDREGLELAAANFSMQRASLTARQRAGLLNRMRSWLRRRTPPS